MPSQDHMKQALQAYVDTFNAGDATAVCGLYADDAVIEDPVGHPPISGRAAIEEFYSNAIAGGAKLTLDAPIRGSHGDRAAMAFTVDVPGPARPRHRRHDLRRGRQDRPHGGPLGPRRHRDLTSGAPRRAATGGGLKVWPDLDGDFLWSSGYHR
ncbi:hypothetical protein BJY14_006627 [Actinomadura luteofluorescens]|uniref:SnoaL-like domain-containing protein n=1 Tax=Actinomadura luteofluorescens TaxID=46163 RepID=A0A7Y9EN45_9ACTN|nr:nuclear transport factor 2 family protein [Actinomadura luteofluorescens]NYD50644.1 hypothetical protein [Actinomadura luteofluorescens]